MNHNRLNASHRAPHREKQDETDNDDDEMTKKKSDTILKVLNTMEIDNKWG